MKLYHHYKNKPYRYIGVARHSETLEEMVIYETLYENNLGKIWVRPKGMFEESIQLNGESVPRFRQIPLALTETTQVTEAELKKLAPVIEASLGSWDFDWLYSSFKNHEKFHLATAFVEGQTVGFKLGYEINSKEFYSWLGGVVPQYRGLGIASALMTCQHDWCRKEGYRTIQTKTQNRFREMLVLNLKSGFDVIGSHACDDGGLKIILEKKLS